MPFLEFEGWILKFVCEITIPQTTFSKSKIVFTTTFAIHSFTRVGKISSLLKISKSEKYSFLLESVEGGSKRGRYSLLGCDPDLIWTVEKGKAKINFQ